MLFAVVLIVLSAAWRIIGLHVPALLNFAPLMALTFWGEERFKKAHSDGHSSHGHDEHHHCPVEPHESPASMTLPLIILAIGSALVGFLGIPGLSAFERWLASEKEKIVSIAAHYDDIVARLHVVQFAYIDHH